MSPKVDTEFTSVLPKCELHAHLSGSISRECLHDIWIDKQARGLCIDLEDPLSAIRPGGDFVDVVSFFPLFDSYIYSLCNDLESVKQATESVLRDFASDGVRHLELRTTPRECLSTDMGWSDYVAIVNETITLWNSNNGERMAVYLILSIDRKMTAEQADKVVDLAIRHQHLPGESASRGFVVGVDLCGNPARGNPATFSGAFETARSQGLSITLHCAEVPQSGSDIELNTLLSFVPDRLGHCIHIPSSVMDVIQERKIGIELCLSCNVLARLTDGGFPDHHFGKWSLSSCAIALGTDDVGVFGSPLSNEYLLASKHFDLKASDLVRLSRQAAQIVFAGRARMEAIIDQFEQNMGL